MGSITYFDYASLTPPVPEALDAMRRASEETWGPPNALHAIGRRAAYALETARRQVAEYLGGSWQEVVFTSSGREALGIAMAHALAKVAKGSTIVASRQDHPALQQLVERTCDHEVRWLALPGGVPSAEDLREIEKASLIALSACNHELGTSLMDVLARAPANAVRVVDAVQVAPWVSLESLNDDRTFFAISGAKLGVSMGVGVARVPSDVFYAARNAGKSIEGASPPWVNAIGLGAACEARGSKRETSLTVARERADELLAAFREIDPEVVINGDAGARLGPIVNVSFTGQYGKSLAAALSLEGVCVSHTAACQASREEVSPVVRAAYPSAPERAVAATRWSVSEHVTLDDIREAVAALRRALRPRRTAG
jgi:cysteine desulfurase